MVGHGSVGVGAVSAVQSAAKGKSAHTHCMFAVRGGVLYLSLARAFSGATYTTLRRGAPSGRSLFWSKSRSIASSAQIVFPVVWQCGCVKFHAHTCTCTYAHSLNTAAPTSMFAFVSTQKSEPTITHTQPVTVDHAQRSTVVTNVCNVQCDVVHIYFTTPTPLPAAVPTSILSRRRRRAVPLCISVVCTTVQG
jgi:hypothetical protein